MPDASVTDPTTAPTGSGAPPADVMIRLEGVTKRYPNQQAPAVQPLTMDVKRGEFVVFVGPSGCGKTTTLRMINRLVEPTAGRIWIDGRDVTDVDPDGLRRTIGYVIQQVGLLPHLTVARNIGLVPGLLGWSRERIARRVDELLDLVGLEPERYRDRHPKQLSGGQQQRVGVARALAADPPVMVMDEPFGAIDPITRDRMQEEFLRLQQRIRKTIVLVTHDIDEALKLGDRIAIFAEGSRLAQFATPLEILTRPADAYVRSFIGTGAEIRRLGLLTAEQVAAAGPAPTAGEDLRVEAGTSVSAVLERMLASGADHAVIEPGSRRLSLRDLLLAAARAAGDAR